LIKGDKLKLNVPPNCKVLVDLIVNELFLELIISIKETGEEKC